MPILLRVTCVFRERHNKIIFITNLLDCYFPAVLISKTVVNSKVWLIFCYWVIKTCNDSIVVQLVYKQRLKKEIHIKDLEKTIQQRGSNVVILVTKVCWDCPRAALVGSASDRGR